MAGDNKNVIEIRHLDIQRVKIRIVGDTPLIVHAWDEKAKKMMLDKQTKATKTASREAKNPVSDFINSMYWLTPKPTEMTEEAFEAAIQAGARFGFPATGFKQAAVSGAYRNEWAKDKMSFRSAFFIDAGESGMIEIIGDPPIMREDMVRIGMGVADIRYRSEFRNWSAVLPISYNAKGKYTLEQIVHVINAGGFNVGVGEWRPERDGNFGRFHVEG